MTATITPAETTVYTPEDGTLYERPLNVTYEGAAPTADEILAAVHDARIRIPALSNTSYALHRAHYARTALAPLVAMRITHRGLETDVDAPASMSPTRYMYVRDQLSGKTIRFILEVREIEGAPLVTGIRPDVESWPVEGGLVGYLRQPEDLETTCLELMEHAAWATKTGRYAEAGHDATYIWALRRAFDHAFSEDPVPAGRHRGAGVWIDIPTVSEVMHAHGEHDDADLAHAYRHDLEMQTGYTIEHRYV